MPSPATARLLLLIALATATAAAHAGPAVDDAAVQAELNALTAEVEALEPTYLAAAALERRYQFTARLSDGQLFFLTGDYDRAAMVLLDLATNPSSQTHPAYRDALYYLAESLYLTRNYKASAGWFDHVAERGDLAQRQHAVARQLEIALRLGDGPAAERALNRARVLLDSTADSTLRYPVIASNVSDNGIILGEKEERGFLCDPLSPADICAAIERRLFAAPKALEQMVSRARTFAAQEFLIDKMVMHYNRIIESVA